jgi:hypothetical protein
MRRHAGKVRGRIAPSVLRRAPARSATAPLWSLSRVAVHPCAPAVQAKLTVGAANDPAEAEADRVANRVIASPAPTARGMSPGAASPIRRKCSACRENDEPGSAGSAPTIRMSPAASPAAAPAASAEAAISGLGPGTPLPGLERTFFEPRFGHDLSGVRLHTGRAADAASRSVGARAFTLGTDIAFAAGAYAPHSQEGRRLIAHELTHVLQQTGGEARPPGPPRIQRKLEIRDAGNAIPNPTGNGLVQTNAQTAQTYLQTLCAAGAMAVDGTSGAVSFGTADFCPTPYPPDFVGPPAPAPSDLSSTPTGCNCLCTMINSATTYTIVIDDTSWPHTSGTVVTAPSPNSEKSWGTATKSGATMAIDPWLVLGHELCGHAYLGEMGLPDDNVTRGEGGHQETVARENLLRGEHGIEERGGFKDPYCGESFSQEKAGPGPINWSSYLEKCKAWRKSNYGDKYKISDRIP